MKFGALSGKDPYMMEYTKKFYCLIVAAILIVSTLTSWDVLAKEAFIKDIKTQIKEDALLISFRVTDCFTDKMIQAIKNGVNTRFVYLIRLYKVRRWWKDKKIADIKVCHTIHYDSIKKVYHLRLSEENKKRMPIKDLEEAKKILARISDLRIIDIKELKKDQKYQIRVKAELDKIRLPLHLHYILFFLSLWNFDTDWYKVNFIYH